MTPKCPACASRETVQITDLQAECLKCGEIFINAAQPIEEAA